MKLAPSLLTEFTLSESLRKHALSVEACLRAYARKFGEDEDFGASLASFTTSITKNILPPKIILSRAARS